LLSAALLSVVAWFVGLSVRWLGSSFAFFVWLCAVGKNANVLPNAWVNSLELF